MSQAYDDYIQRKEAYDGATDAIQRLVNELRSFAAPLLTDWSKCYIQLPGQNVPMGMAKRKAIDRTKMPQVQDLHRALVAQFNAQEEAHKAWMSLPSPERDNLKPPPWLVR